MKNDMASRVQDMFAQTKTDEKIEIEKAGKIIQDGGIVAFPTETVYGLGANALNSEAVAKVYEAKGRPSDNPLILHVCDLEMAESVVELNWLARYLMEIFWPGPLSLVLVAKKIVPQETRGGLSTAAIRMPDNRIALELIRAAGVPIAAPSANKSGRPSPTDAQTVKDDIGDAAGMVLDGGSTRVGLESTVLDITGEDPVLLRPGGISKEQIEEALHISVLLPKDNNVIKRSPGTRYRHYAPKIPMILSDKKGQEISSDKKWAWMGISQPEGTSYVKIIFADADEYAKELFRALRTLEKSGAEIIVAEIPEEIGIGSALKDRLIRASGI